MTKNEIADVLTEIGTLLELKGENPFKTRAYKMGAEIAAERAKAEQADKVVEQLKALESSWDRLVGNPEQQKANAEQRARMEAVRGTARAKAAAIGSSTWWSSPIWARRRRGTRPAPKRPTR